MALTYLADQVEASPPWLQSPFGAAWGAALGANKDWIVTLIKEATKARMPLICAPDALARIGEERGIIRGVTEPVAAYRTRLQQAFALWQWGGTAYGLLAAFYSAGYPNPIVWTQSGKSYQLAGYTGDPAIDLVSGNLSTPVHLGGSPVEVWSDFAVLIGQPWPSWWGGSVPADGSADQQAAVALIKAWKPGHCRNVKLNAFNGVIVGSGITVGSFTVGGGVTVWTPALG